MSGWISFATFAGLVITAAGFAAFYLGLPRPWPHPRLLLALGITTLVSVVIFAFIFLPRSKSGTSTAPTISTVPPSPESHAHRQARRYDTKFFHSQTIEGATWAADGVPITPIATPAPSMTVLTLTEGSHEVLAKANGKVCRAPIRVPVPSGEQPVTLNCTME